MDHYTVYRKGCLELNLNIHERAMPEEEMDRKNGLEVPLDV
jgi:hypothetical protein